MAYVIVGERGQTRQGLSASDPAKAWEIACGLIDDGYVIIAILDVEGDQLTRDELQQLAIRYKRPH